MKQRLTRVDALALVISNKLGGWRPLDEARLKNLFSQVKPYLDARTADTEAIVEICRCFGEGTPEHAHLSAYVSNSAPLCISFASSSASG